MSVFRLPRVGLKGVLFFPSMLWQGLCHLGSPPPPCAFLAWLWGTGTGATITKHLFLSAPAFQLSLIASVGGAALAVGGRDQERDFSTDLLNDVITHFS